MLVICMILAYPFQDNDNTVWRRKFSFVQTPS